MIDSHITLSSYVLIDPHDTIECILFLYQDIGFNILQVTTDDVNKKLNNM